MSDHSFVSVLICTYNRHELLQSALVTLIESTTEKPDEIVVVNGGDERADKVVEAFKRQQTIVVQLVKTVNVNLATSRNIGLPYCRGNIVAMTDDDAIVFPDWISQIKRAHKEHPEAGVIGGSIIGANSANSLLSRLSDLVTFPQPNRACYVRTVPGVNVSYKRAPLDQVGEQDVSLPRGEDVDFNWRIKKLGYEIYFCPDIKVIHYHRPSLKRFFNQHYMYGRSYYKVRTKWPEMYCVYPHHLSRPRDFIKGINFFLAIFYQPVLDAKKLGTWTDCMRAIPILFVNHWLWKWGMIQESIISSRNNKEVQNI